MWPVLILQPRPVNHDQLTTTCASLAFELIKERSSMPQYASKWRDKKVIDMETHFFNILDKKTIQNGIFSIGWHLISFKNFYCCVLLKF